MTDYIKQSIDIAAPVERVYHALTNHAEFGSWFRVAIETPFELGKIARGKVLHPGFEHVTWQVRIVAMEPPKLFSFTWHPYAVKGDVDYDEEIPTLVEFRLKATASGTHVTVTESGFDAVPAARRAEAFRMNNGGWEAQMRNIKHHVEG